MTKNKKIYQEKDMDKTANKEKFLFHLFGMLIVLSIMVSFAGAGCSKKTASTEKPVEEESATATEPEQKGIEYAPVQEQILSSVRDNYKDWGTDIQSIELQRIGKEWARITLTFPGHTQAMEVVAGLTILHDNFPKMDNYAVVSGGDEWTCSRDRILYIDSRNFGPGSTDEEAEMLFGVVKNGVPSPTQDEPDSVNVE